MAANHGLFKEDEPFRFYVDTCQVNASNNQLCTHAGGGRKLWAWLKANFSALQKQVKLFSQHAELVDLAPFRFGRILVVLFHYCTQDAAGQNMVTSGTWHSCKWVLRKVEQELPNVKVINFWIESDMSGDKKIAAMNLFQTRGIHAQAEAWVPEEILRSVLKVRYVRYLKTIL